VQAGEAAYVSWREGAGVLLPSGSAA